MSPMRSTLHVVNYYFGSFCFDSSLENVQTLDSCSHVSVVLQCLNLVYGDDKEVLVDHSIDHCVFVPQSPDGLSVQYELSVNSACGNGIDVTVHVTMDQRSNCTDLVSALSVKEADDDCSTNSIKIKRCSLIDSVVDFDRKVCRFRCKCADSGDSCLLQIYSKGLVPNPPEIKICEIEVVTP